MLALAAATIRRPERIRALVDLEVLVPGADLESRADALGAVEPQVVVLDLAVVVFGVPRAIAIVVVDALEEGGQRLLLAGRHAVDAHADDGSLVDLAEVEAERRFFAERRRRPEQVLLLRDPDHQIVGVEVLVVLALAVRVEIGRVDHVVVGYLAADRQRQVARRAALGSAEADQQFHVVRILAQDAGNLVDVGGDRPAPGSEIGGRQLRGERERRHCAPDRDLHPRCSLCICAHRTRWTPMRAQVRGPRTGTPVSRCRRAEKSRRTCDGTALRCRTA